jgi:hypothetical protein
MPDPINECYRRIRLKEKLKLAHQLLIIGITYTIAMTRHIVFIVALILLSGCNNQKTSEHNEKEQIQIKNAPGKLTAEIYTDTLQFIYFEGNFDYWSCVFLNSKKDTITLVTNSMIANKFKNTLFEVKWMTDTLYEAGDNDSKYAANRMMYFKPLHGDPFVAPVTEEQILKDVRSVPEVQSGADQVTIAERPSDGKDYYLVETGTHESDNYSRFLMLKAFIYPRYEIKVYDPAKEIDLSLDEWRNLQLQ